MDWGADASDSPVDVHQYSPQPVTEFTISTPEWSDETPVAESGAQRQCVLLLRTSGSHMLRKSISAIHEKLNLHGFARIHRSAALSVALKEIHPLASMCSAGREEGSSQSLVLTRRICNSWLCGG